ncbi:MAG: replicative DNA helicase [Verrucomicrobiota bacterium]|nr:replicative DNA helicase [Verrucomicrobiota bacterium]
MENKESPQLAEPSPQLQAIDSKIKSVQSSRGNSAPTAQEISRTLPSNTDAEKGVISAMLQSPDDIVGEAVQKLDPEAFYVPAHKTLFELLINLTDEGKPIDPITLQEALMRENLMDSVGGPSAVLELIDFVPDASHFEFYVEIVKEKHLLREIISTCTGCINSAYTHEGDASHILDKVEQNILDIGDSEDKADDISMKDHVFSAIANIESMYENRGTIQGLATGFRDIDKLLNGMHSGQMIVIAARPSMGKTSLAMNIAEHVSVDQEKAVAIFSLEMTTQDLVQRLLCSRARVNGQKIRAGIPDSGDFPKLMKAAGELSKSKMLIDETPGISIMEMRAKARRMKQRDNIELLIVDYLQLMRSNTKRGNDNRQIEISEISAGLKALAKELHIPVIVVAQVNRNPEERKGGRPRISDLRESGSIEQDADVVGLLMRPEHYAEDDDERESLEGEATFIVAKQRNGPIGDIHLTFIDNQVRFADRSYEDEHG